MKARSEPSGEIELELIVPEGVTEWARAGVESTRDKVKRVVTNADRTTNFVKWRIGSGSFASGVGCRGERRKSLFEVKLTKG
jgi:hypothetical protein